ncbi:MAG TPA: ATP-binding protein [Gemmataceae bacterium]
MQWNNARTTDTLIPPFGDLEIAQEDEISAAERARGESGRIQAQLFYQEWYEFAPIGYLTTDLHGVIVEANYAAAELVNVPKEFLIGKPLGFLLTQEHRSTFYKQLVRLANGEVIGWWEVTLGRPVEERRVVLLSATLLPNKNGRPVKVRWTLRDVTQLREAQKQLIQRERLAAIGEVSAGLAHEGRNALQRIQANLSLLLLRLADQPEALELVEHIQIAQDDLRRLFDDVRTYAVGPSVRLDIHDLRPCWREAWEELTEARSQKKAELYEETEGMDLFCLIDPFYVKNVFRNLLENALTSGADPVRIVLRCHRALLGEREAVRVSVCDNGPGIPELNRRHLFEPFFTTKLRGTGLGLAICKRIIEAHGGRIEASPKACPGAEIVVTLPRRRT